MAFPVASPTKLAELTLNELAPRPEKSVQDYTDEKISERLDYVRQTKGRNVSPRTQTFLTLYEGELEKTLPIKDYAQKLQACQKLHLYDQYIQESSFLCYNPSATELELQEKTLQLRKLQYYCRYGDYWAREIKTLKDGARANMIPNRKVFDDYWTNIDLKIKEERKMSSVRSHPTPTLSAVFTTCSLLGISATHMLWVIERYAERNEQMHSTVNEWIRRGFWTDLAVLLYNDEQDIDFLIPEELAEDRRHMKITISEVKDSYFDIGEGDEDDPRTWTPSQNGKQLKGQFRDDLDKELAEELNAKEKEIAQVNVRITEKEIKITRQEEKTLRALRGIKRKSGSGLERFQTQENVKRKHEVEQLLGIQAVIDSMERKLAKQYNTRDELLESLRSWALVDEQDED